jgi:hypothetical protein
MPSVIAVPAGRNNVLRAICSPIFSGLEMLSGAGSQLVARVRLDMTAVSVGQHVALAVVATTLLGKIGGIAPLGDS